LAATHQGDEVASAKAEAPQAAPQVPQAPKTDGGAAVPVGAGAGAGANVSSLPDRRLEALQRPTALAQIARTVATRVAQGGVMGQESGARN
jgi:hypothetical protein